MRILDDELDFVEKKHWGVRNGDYFSMQARGLRSKKNPLNLSIEWAIILATSYFPGRSQYHRRWRA